MNETAEVASREELQFERGPDGDRVPEKRHIDYLGKPVKIVEPTWGEKREFKDDFGKGDVEAKATDPELIAKHISRAVVEPDMSDLTAEEVDNKMPGNLVQDLMDEITEMYFPEQAEGEADQKKSGKQR